MTESKIGKGQDVRHDGDTPWPFYAMLWPVPFEILVFLQSWNSEKNETQVDFFVLVAVGSEEAIVHAASFARRYS